MMNALSLIGLPVGLGLLGFIEPCSVGSSLLFIKSLENRSTSERAVQVLIFTTVRAVLMGMLGLLAVLIGSLFLAFQKLHGPFLVWCISCLIDLSGWEIAHLFVFSRAAPSNNKRCSRVGNACNFVRVQHSRLRWTITGYLSRSNRNGGGAWHVKRTGISINGVFRLSAICRNCGG